MSQEYKLLPKSYIVGEQSATTVRSGWTWLNINFMCNSVWFFNNSSATRPGAASADALKVETLFQHPVKQASEWGRLKKKICVKGPLKVIFLRKVSRLLLLCSDFITSTSRQVICLLRSALNIPLPHPCKWKVNWIYPVFFLQISHLLYFSWYCHF